MTLATRGTPGTNGGPAYAPDEPAFVCGLDLGQTSDPSALAILERVPVPRDPGVAMIGLAHEYRCVHLARWLGEPYPRLVSIVGEILARPELRPTPRVGCPLVCLDATGVGRAVADLALAAGWSAEVVPLTITAGAEWRRDRWPGGGASYFVPKKDLVSSVQVALQTGALRVAAGLPLAEVLKAELLGFRVRVTAAANEQFGEWRTGKHDDLVLATAVAIWAGEHAVDDGRLFY